MLPCVCSVIDHRGRQNVVRTSVTHSAAPRVPLFCSYHILTSSVIYYWTDARQRGIYLLIAQPIRLQKSSGCSIVKCYTKIWYKTSWPGSNFQLREMTKLTFQAFVLPRYFPIRLRRWRFEPQPFVVTFSLDYKDDVSSISPSSWHSIMLRRWRFERLPFVLTFRLDYEDDVSSLSPSPSLSITFRSWRFER